jgi:hypothetical protein
VIAEQTEPLLSSKLLYRSLEDVSSASLMVTYRKHNSEKFYDRKYLRQKCIGNRR